MTMTPFTKEANQQTGSGEDLILLPPPIHKS